MTGRLQAQTTLRGDGGLWALKARYVAATKAVPGQLRAARDAEDHASRLADTLAQANERFAALNGSWFERFAPTGCPWNPPWTGSAEEKMVV